MASVTREYVKVAGLVTEIYRSRPQSGISKLQICIFPGNPGNAGFYSYFMSCLNRHFNQDVDILAVSHVGHDPEAHNGDKVWCLASQIDHKVAFLKEHVLLPGRPPVVLMAHSIGTYMMLHALQELEADPGLQASGTPQVLKVIGLFPFLSADFTSAKQRFLRIMAEWHEQVALLGGALGRLPQRLQDYFIRSLGGDMDEHAVEVVKSLLRWGSLRNNFHLAWHEFRDLAAPGDWALLQRLGSRAAIICAPNDHWFPRKHYDDMVANVAGLQTFWREDCSHAFCVSKQQCEVVAGLAQHILTSDRAIWRALCGEHVTWEPKELSRAGAGIGTGAGAAGSAGAAAVDSGAQGADVPRSKL